MIVHGVDFSGARRAREKICVATLDAGGNGEGVARVERGVGHEDLVERIARSGDDGRRHAWLIDATFGLPLELLAEHGVEARWAALAEWLASFPSARDWRRAARQRSRKEHRRAADRIAKTPFAPTNLRMFKQTWHSIVSVLLPLSREPEVALWPLDLLDPQAARLAGGSPSRGVPGLTVEGAAVEGEAPAEPLAARRSRRVWVGEGCPSSVLRAAGLPHRGYKGPTERNREMRRELLRWLEGPAMEGPAPSGPLRMDGTEAVPPTYGTEAVPPTYGTEPVPPTYGTEPVPPTPIRVAPDAAALALDDPEGDALDALLLLPAARRFAASDPAAVLAIEPRASVEGWVYV